MRSNRPHLIQRMEPCQTDRVTISGQIVILNGAPRSGKSSIADFMKNSFPGKWVNLGVDSCARWIPERLQPGIGLRPGGERPDLEEPVVILYKGLYMSIAAHAKLGLSVVVDVGHHDSYSRPLGILPQCARQLSELPVLFVGVRCPIDVIWQRREQTWSQVREAADKELLAAVERWQQEVHSSWSYDVEVDTSVSSAQQCAEIIADRLSEGPPGKAFKKLAALD